MDGYTQVTLDSRALVGTWIESFILYQEMSMAVVVPSWARGLKESDKSVTSFNIGRALVGTWIESHKHPLNMRRKPCRALVGTWIESAKAGVSLAELAGRALVGTWIERKIS